MRLYLAHLALALLILWPAGPARAKEVWTSEEGGVSLDLAGFYKSFAVGLLLPEGLVGSTEALAELMDEARAILPPEQAEQLPAFQPLPGSAGLSTQVFRVSARLLLGERIDAELAWQLGASIASDPAFAGGAVLGGSALGPGSEARRRLVDFEGLLASSGTLRLRHDLDRLAVKFRLPGVDVVVGRQVLGWGSGRLWNPTDLLSPFAPTDIDTEVRRGVDALRVSIPLGFTGLLDALWLPQARLADQGGVVRAQVNVLEYDLSLSAAKYVSDVVLGADLAGDVGPLGVYAEAAYTLGYEGWDEGPLTLEERFLRAVGGVQWRPHERLVVLGEYHYNGFGAKTPAGYMAKLQSDRVARGEIFGAGRHYFGLVTSWMATDLISINATALVNLQDPSAMLVPVVEWSLEQSVLLRVGAFVPLGRGADPSALRALGPEDVIQGTPAFTDAASSLGLRSEYGASGAGLLVQLATYR